MTTPSSSGAVKASVHLVSNVAAVEEAVNEADQTLVTNVDGYIHGDVHGFYQKYFENTSWSSAIKRTIQQVDPKIVNGCWTVYPERPSRDEFLVLIRTAEPICSHGRGFWSTFPRGAPEPSGQRSKTHLIFTLEAVSSKNKHPWVGVQVIGEFCDVSIKYRDGFSHLLRLAQEVFSRQPTRLFLHGFYIRGSMMELWVFDRSGVYSAAVFDIRKNPERFLNVMVSYRLMGDEELGMNSLFREDEAGKYITMRAEDKKVGARLYLEPRPIAISQDIVGEGTTCYRAKRLNSNGPEFIVKLKWRLATKRPEEKLLKLVQERRVSGVVRFLGHQDLDSTGGLRQGLHFGSYRRFLTEISHPSDTKQVKPSEESHGAIPDLNDAQGDDAIGVLGYTVEKKKWTPKQKSDQNDEPFEERIFSCVVTYPAGRPLLQYKSVLELLEAFRDAMQGHRSLYQQGKILHQDVSIDNIIIITDAAAKGDPKGIMIDLDVAMELETGPRQPRELLGTKPFMAIGILRGKSHTYRHDLESFLYVFLWTAICNRTSHQVPTTSRLRRWSSAGSRWGDLAQMKTHDMRKEQLERLMAEEFPPDFRGLEHLVDNLRQLLFPIRDGVVCTETDPSAEGVDRLYDGMVGAFDTAIESYPSNSLCNS